jgi:hypothetical protein
MKISSQTKFGYSSMNMFGDVQDIAQNISTTWSIQTSTSCTLIILWHICHWHEHINGACYYPLWHLWTTKKTFNFFRTWQLWYNSNSDRSTLL